MTFSPKKSYEYHIVHKARCKGKNVFTRLGEGENDVFSRLGHENTSRLKHASAYPKTRPTDEVDLANHKKSTQAVEEYFSKNKNDRGGHWKSKSKKPKSTTDEEDLSQPWLCEETDPFTLRIRNFEFPKRICMP
ncbi:hypothetical protein Tco_0182663, partial [Tanacetum coccineum]